jgi:hypothetical protein
MGLNFRAGYCLIVLEAFVMANWGTEIAILYEEEHMNGNYVGSN